MLNVTVFDLLPHVSNTTPDHILSDPQGMSRASFSLLCSVEHFAQQLDGSMAELAEVLFEETSQFYDLIQAQTLAGTQSRWLDVEAIYQAYQRLESLINWVDSICDELPADHWLTKQSWSSAQRNFQVLRPALIRKMRRDM